MGSIFLTLNATSATGPGQFVPVFTTFDLYIGVGIISSVSIGIITTSQSRKKVFLGGSRISSTFQDTGPLIIINETKKVTFGPVLTSVFDL